MHYTYHYKIPVAMKDHLKTFIGQPLMNVTVIFGHVRWLTAVKRGNHFYADSCYLCSYLPNQNKSSNPLRIAFKTLPWGILGAMNQMEMHLFIQKDAYHWINQQLQPHEKSITISGAGIPMVEEIRIYSHQSTGHGDADIDENYADDTYEADIDTMLVLLLSNNTVWCFMYIFSSEPCDGVEVAFYHDKRDFEQHFPDRHTILGESLYQKVEILR